MRRIRLVAASGVAKGLVSVGLFSVFLIVGPSAGDATIIGYGGGVFVGMNASYAGSTSNFANYAKTEASTLSNGNIPLARLGSSGTCVMSGVGPTSVAPQQPLSNFTNNGVAIDLLVKSAYPCDQSFPGTGVNGMLQNLIYDPTSCPYNTGTSASDDTCCPQTDWPSGLSAMEKGAYCWAFNAYDYYEANCGNTGNCPELEVLNEPAVNTGDDGQDWWGSQAYSYKNGSGQYVNQNAYAYLLSVTSNYFDEEMGADSPIILGSYDGGMNESPGSTEWGANVWNNTAGSGGSKLDLSGDYLGFTDHVYTHNCSNYGSTQKEDVTNAESTGLPVYVTEFGWDGSGTLDTGGTACGYQGGTWDTTSEPSYFCSFMNWALNNGVAQVFPFEYTDYGVISPSYAGWWGMTYWNEPDAAGQSPDYSLNGTPKPVWTTVTDFASSGTC